MDILECIFGNGICSGSSLDSHFGLVFMNTFPPKMYLNYILHHFVCSILCIHIRDICEHVNLDATSQYNGVFNIQFCSNHNLAIPLNEPDL